ncbi:hypothetical protein B0H21DRAFT_3460 [Amylocystis lapponica]|nr:hypothetical protein B0H21DRAFT_3460 [Amylocystis lapponica]
MSLLRYAQTNSAGTQSASPRSASSASSSRPSTPIRNGGLPLTPRTRISYPISPVTSPSLSASRAFDWEAARSGLPAPYATPLRGKGRKSAVGIQNTPKGTPGKKHVRKKTFLEKVRSLPSKIAFELALFPHNVPLPPPRTSAWLLGGTAHFLHLCVRLVQINAVPDSDLGWEDMYREGQDEPWFDWTVPTTALLFTLAILNTLYLFTHTRMYQLNLAEKPVGSPHAAFVPRPRREYSPPPARTTRSLIFAILAGLWRAFVASVRFLFNLSPPKSREAQNTTPDAHVQQLEVWTPGELEVTVFAVYSPLHALLWTALSTGNWIRIIGAMVLASAQLRAMTRAYEALMKDRTIIAAEVLHEYDEKFVIPRVNPVRKDAAVMTHQAEVVNVWED